MTFHRSIGSNLECRDVREAGGPVPSPRTGPSFNVFRRRGSDSLCAVPLDRPVPAFVDETWQLVCDACEAQDVPGLGDIAGARERNYTLARHVASVG
ncbi:hypothetical protein ACTZWW_17960 [Salinarimonas sp. NSM]|uniref:hypothetical protein n=1 Tax=Salinarimonas sp. NSM TaxID=3458003 RepID=UPI004036C192